MYVIKKRASLRMSYKTERNSILSIRSLYTKIMKSTLTSIFQKSTTVKVCVIFSHSFVFYTYNG